VWVTVVGLTGLTLLVSTPSLLSNPDDDWTGFWSSGRAPGSVADTADMHPSDVDLRLEMYSRKGHLTGMIAADQICLSKPFTSFLLFEGEASGSSATITAYDSHGGKRSDFVKAKLERDGAIMTVVPMDGNVEWLPKMTRVERDLKSHWIERSNFRDFCTPERHAVLRQRFGKSELTDEEKARVLLK
jgi:hypothetical protein